jgi:hypothetical protein
MPVFLKRWFRSRKTACIAVVSLYLFITIVNPAHHTCSLGNLDHCNEAYHYSCPKTNLGNHIEIPSKQDKSNLFANYDLCLACMYSITCNSTQVSTAVAITSHEDPTLFRYLPHSTILKPSEWLSSISLRAPPSNIS